MVVRWKKRKKDNDLETPRKNVIVNGDGSRQSSGIKLSNLRASRAIIALLGFIALLFQFQIFNKPPTGQDFSLFGEISSMESNMAMIQGVTTNLLSSSTTSTESIMRRTSSRELLNNNNNHNFEYVASSIIPPSDPRKTQLPPGSQPNLEATSVPAVSRMSLTTSPPSTSEQQQLLQPKLTKKQRSTGMSLASPPAPLEQQQQQQQIKPKRTKKQRSTSISLPGRQNEHKKVVTVVVQLNGELGNQMHKIANGVCVQKHIERKLHLPTELVLRAQDSPKWEHSMKWMKEAFPNTRPLNFRAGNTPLFDQVRLIQESWIQHLVDTHQVKLDNIGNPKILNRMKSSGWQPTMEVLRLLNQTWYMDRPMAPGGSTEFSIPHVYSDTFTSRYCFEKMLPEIRDFFRIDEEAICKQTPEPDESVLHLRNFLVEMPEEGRELGFEELNPNKTATEIFKDYNPGDKVAIVSRYQNNTDKYIKALKDIRGIEARYIEGQTGNQDFCFLLKTQQEIIGQRISTYATWAGLLGKPKKLRLYSVDSKYTRAKKKNFYSAKWKHPELKHLIVYENYKA